MKEKITIFQIVVILAIVVVFVFFWYQNQENDKKMIKIDACLKVCSNTSFKSVSGLKRFGSPDYTKCREECMEKYGISWEKYNKWKKQENGSDYS